MKKSFLFLMLASLSMMSFASQFYWISTSDQNWNNPSNWNIVYQNIIGVPDSDDDGLPDENDDVHFNQEGTVSCTSDQDVTIRSLTVTTNYTDDNDVAKILTFNSIKVNEANINADINSDNKLTIVITDTDDGIFGVQGATQATSIYNSIFKCKVDINAYWYRLSHNQFNQKIILGCSAERSETSNNIFDGDVEIDFNKSMVDMSSASADTYNGDIILSYEQRGKTRLGWTCNDCTWELKNEIVIENPSIGSKDLYIKNMDYTSDKDINLNDIAVFHMEEVVINREITFNTFLYRLKGNTFNEKVRAGCGSNNSWTTGNTFREDFEVFENNGRLYMSNDISSDYSTDQYNNGEIPRIDTYEGNIILSYESNGVVYLGWTCNDCTWELENEIIVKEDSKNIGYNGRPQLYIMNMNQTSDLPISLGKISSLRMSNNEIKTDISFDANVYYLAENTFDQNVIAGNSIESITYGNTFKGDYTIFRNENAGSVHMSYHYPLNFNYKEGFYEYGEIENDTYEGDIILSYEQLGSTYLGWDCESCEWELKNNILIENEKEDAKKIYIKNMNHTSTSPIDLKIINRLEIEGVEMNTDILFNTNDYFLRKNTFNGKVNAGNDRLSISSGNIFEKELEVFRIGGPVNDAKLIFGEKEFDIFNDNVTLSYDNKNAIVSFNIKDKEVTFKDDFTVKNTTNSQGGINGENIKFPETTTFTGNESQIIHVESSHSNNYLIFNNLNINNANDLSLKGQIRINSGYNLDFQEGKILADNEDLLGEVMFLNTATASNYGNEKYVDGTVTKIGDEEFIFPVGDADFFKPLQMTNPNNTEASISTIYHRYDSEVDGYTRANKEEELVDYSVSNQEYWLVTQNDNSSQSIDISLAYNDDVWNGFTNPKSNDPEDLVIARWATDSEWKNEGNGGVFSDFDRIQTGTSLSSFGPMTFAIEEGTKWNCDQEFYCADVITKPVVDVIGFDVEIDYESTLVKPTGKITLYADVLEIGGVPITEAQLNSYVREIHKIDASKEKLLISVYFNGNAPKDLTYTGAGRVLCAEFEKADGSPLGAQQVNFEIPFMRESYADRVVLQDADNFGVQTTTSGILNFWRNDALIQHGTTTVEVIDGNTNNVIDQLVVNEDGEFNYSHSPTNLLKIIRDIDGNSISSNLNPSVYKKVFTSVDEKVIELILTLSSQQEIIDYLLDNDIVITEAEFPYVLLAADVNLDGVISAGDFSQIQQRSTGIAFEYKQNGTYDQNGNSIDVNTVSKDWLFIKKSDFETDLGYAISTSFPYDDEIGMSRDRVKSIPELLPVPMVCQDSYVGILLGDVTGNWQALGNNKKAQLRISETSNVKAIMREEVLDGKVAFDIYFEEIPKVVAFDFMLGIGDNEVVDVTSEYENNSLFNVYNKSLLFTGFGYDGISIEKPVMTIYFAENTFDGSSIEEFTVYLSEKEVQSEVLFRVSGLTEENISSALELYPNPAENEVTIKGLSGECSYQIFNMLGEIVMTGNYTTNQTINISTLSKGVYVIGIQQGNSVANKKLIID